MRRAEFCEVLLTGVGAVLGLGDEEVHLALDRPLTLPSPRGEREMMGQAGRTISAANASRASQS
jgi:hypothetical protein